MAKVKIKKIIIVLFFSAVIYVLNGGVAGDTQIKTQSSFLVAVFALSIFFPKLRMFFLKFALVLLAAMVAFYILQAPENIEIANLLGSTAFGIIVLVILVYIPEILEKGYISELKNE